MIVRHPMGVCLMSGIDDSILDKWRNGSGYEQVACFIWVWYVQGNERGSELPTITALRLATDRFPAVISKAKRLLGKYGALAKQNGRWVVALAAGPGLSCAWIWPPGGPDPSWVAPGVFHENREESP